LRAANSFQISTDNLDQVVGGIFQGLAGSGHPQATDQPSQMESCQAGISNCRSRCSLKGSEFLGSENQIPQITENTEKSK
jgi:hypothetical protein